MKRDDETIEQVGQPLQAAIFTTIVDVAETPTYPADTGGTIVYKAALLTNPTFPLQQGAQSLTGTLSVRTAYLLGSGTYYPAGSKVLAEQINNRWWIRGLIDEA